MENNKNLESSIKDCIAKELEKGIVEKVISEQLEGCIKDALKDMFGWNGDVRKVVEDKVKSVMIPYLENYDYSKYIVKLDGVLTEVLKTSSLENKKLLENFKELITFDKEEKFKMSDIFQAWTKYCEDNIDRDKLDFDCDGAYMTTTISVEDVSSSWSDFKRYMVILECEEDEELKFEFPISCWEKYHDTYTSDYNAISDLRSLRHLNDFEMLLLKISQGINNIELDVEDDSEDTLIEYEG